MPEQSWFKLGFPDLEPATDRQKAFVEKSWRRLAKILGTNELVMVELMGRDEWIDGLSKIRAGELISAAKTMDDRKQRMGVADPLTASTQGYCPNCQKKMQPRLMGFKCLICGATLFLVGRKRSDA